jgi:hypothetical protein
MKVHILTNALDYGDAVSTHCVLLKRRSRELGIPAVLYAESAHDQMRDQVDGSPELLERARPEDVLLHQLFNDTGLMPQVERFPGRRILMYHNITPPEYFDRDSPVYSSCLRGLRLVRSIRNLYAFAVGMSDASRRDLEGLGFPNTGVFPLLVDLEGLTGQAAHPALTGRPKPGGTVFLFVGRIAPNKRIEDLLRFLAAYRRRDPQAMLLLVGNDRQHPGYVRNLLRVAAGLSLRAGRDVVFAGKVPESHLVAHYRTSDAFISMSEHEGFCAPLLEAMAFGLPVFAYAIPACEETLGGAGVLFRDKSFEVLADLVAGVLHDPARKQELLASQRRRLADFTPGAQRQALDSLLDNQPAVAAASRPPQRVTVIINTYNRARRLERCLATLAEQTFRDFEVVVVNGPSVDDTPGVLARFAGRIRVVQTPSRVLSVSRNEGIAAASGDLIAFIDDDAVAHPRWLEEMALAFQEPGVGAAGGLVFRMNGRDIEFRNGILDREGFVRWNQPAPGLHWDWEEGYLNTVSGNNCMFRRSALERIQGFDERIEYYHDEADVVLRLRLAGFRTVHRPAAVVYHESAPSLNRRSTYRLNWFAICKNTVYCAVKNYDGRLANWRFALRVALRVARERALPMLAWLLHRNIGLADWIRMEAACARGIAVGVTQALRTSPRHRDFGPRSGSVEFVPFPAPQLRQLSVCLLSQNLPEGSPGGIATYTVALAQGLSSLGCQVHVVTRGQALRSELKHGIWYHQADAVALPEEVLNGSGYSTLARNLAYSNGARARVLDIEARWGVDLIESPNWDVEGLLAAMEHRHPIVVRAHSPLSQVTQTQGWDLDDDLRLCSAMEGVLLRHANAVSGSTTALLELVDRQFGSRSKQVLLPLGLEIAPGPPAQDPAGRGIILFVGRLERRKGVQVLLQAIPEILRQAPHACLEIVGRDCGAGENQSWQQWWERNGSASVPPDHVRFHGQVGEEELARWYGSCDIFVAPSLFESFGLIYLEAMARGKPVVACRVGGVPEVVLDGETGLLVPPEDPHALAEAILKLLRDRSLCERLGKAGRQRYLDFFTTQAMAARSLELYSRLAREWLADCAPVWRGGPLDLVCHPDCETVWIPETGRICLLAPAGPPRCAVYGPYIRLKPGLYRAEFKLWLGADPPPFAELARVEVFSGKRGYAEQRVVWSEDFTAGPGCVFDVFFEVPYLPPDDYEFRMHTSGCVPVYVREITVRPWPHPAFADALGAGRLARIRMA